MDIEALLRVGRADERDSYVIALRRFEIEIGTHGWDKPPLLAGVSRTEVPALGHLVMLYPYPVTFPDHPVEVLDAMTQLIRRKPAYRDTILAEHGGQLAGLALSTESWLLMSDLDNPAEIRQVESVAAARKIHAHPRRIEARAVTGVFVDHDPIEVVHLRGGETIVSDPGTASGAIVTGLRDLLEVLTAAP